MGRGLGLGMFVRALDVKKSAAFVSPCGRSSWPFKIRGRLAPGGRAGNSCGWRCGLLGRVGLAGCGGIPSPAATTSILIQNNQTRGLQI